MLSVKRFFALFIVCAVILTNLFVVSAETINIELENSLDFSSGGAYLMCTSDNYIFAATGSSAKLAYEISVYDKETLKFLTSITASSPSTIYLNVNAIHVKGDFLYAAFIQRSGNGNPMLCKYDINEVYEGQKITPVKVVGMRPKGYSYMDNDVVCRSDSGYQNITFMSIDDLEDISAIGVSNAYATTLKSYTKMHIANNVCYGVYNRNLYIYDAQKPLSGISRQDTQVYKGTYKPGSSAINALCGEDNYLYVATTEGVYTLDMENLSSPLNKGLISGTYGAKEVKINNGYLYVATSSEVKIYSLADKENPTLFHSFSVSGVTALHLRTGKIYAATSKGLRVYKVSGLEIEETTIPGSDAGEETVTFKKKIDGISNAEKILADENYLYVLNTDKTEISVYEKETYNLVKTISKSVGNSKQSITEFFCEGGYLHVSYDGVFRKYEIAKINDASLKEETVLPLFSDMTRDVANIVAETNNYIFIAATDNVNREMLANAKIFVYDKKNYEYITSIHMDTGNSNYDMAVRSMWGVGNKLYVSYNNAKTAKTYSGSLSAVLADYSRTNSPLCVYNVESVAKNAVVAPKIICSNSEVANLSHPYNRGGSSYYDKEESLLYQGIYTLNEGQTYKAFDVSNGDGTLKLTLKNGSYDCVKFTVKNGYLFEILQNNGGLTKSGTTSQSFNKVLVYDITKETDADTEIDLTERLIGSYQTSVYGDNIINDASYVGDSIYVATTSGIDVLSFDDFEKKSSLLDGKRVNSLCVEGDLLFASYNGGVSVYNAKNGAELLDEYSSSNVYNLTVNGKEGKLYITSSGINGYGAVLSYADISAGVLKANIPYLKTVDKTSSALATTAWSANTGQMVAENDKYIFVVLSKSGYTTCGVVQIFDKADGTLLTTISEATSNATRYRGIRNIHVKDDVLYIMWGNGYNAGETLAYTQGTTMSPLKAYDVSNVEKGATLTGFTIVSGGQRAATHAPYIAGNISYMNEETGEIYMSMVERKNYGLRNYLCYDTDETKAALKASSLSGLSVKRFNTGSLSMNAVKFIIKDGWLYELLQNKAGLTSYPDADTTDNISDTPTLVNSKGEKINNMVRVYDLNGLNLTAEAQNIESHLRGTYITQTSGDAAIRDIEVIGDYLYASTVKGVEVVPLGSAKQAGVTSAVSLEAVNILKGSGGARDLDAQGTMLYASFEGPESFAGPNSTSRAGEVIAYKTEINPASPEIAAKQEVAYGALDIAVNMKERAIYILNDTMGPPSMTAYSYGALAPMLGVGIDNISFEYVGPMILEDIKSYYVNSGGSYYIVGTGADSSNIDKLLVYNASTKIKTCEITKDAGAVSNLEVFGNYFCMYEGNKLNVYKIPSTNSALENCLFGTYQASGDITGISSNGNYVYLATKNGMVLLNASTVAQNPDDRIVFSGEEITDVCYSGHYVYGTKASGEVFVYDTTTYSTDAISDADSEKAISEIAVYDSEIFGITESGEVLIYETSEDVVITYDVDIKTPVSKKLTDEKQKKGFPYIEFKERVYSTHDKVVANEKYVITAGAGDIIVFDTNLNERFTIDTSNVSYIYLEGDKLIVADASGGVKVSAYNLADETLAKDELVSLSGSGLVHADENSIVVYDKTNLTLCEYSHDGELLKEMTDAPSDINAIYHDEEYTYLVSGKIAKIYDLGEINKTAQASDVYKNQLETVQKITAIESVAGYFYVSTNGGNSTEGGNSASNRLYVYSHASVETVASSPLSYTSRYSTSTSEQGGGKITDFTSFGDFLIVDAIDSKEIQIVNIKNGASPYLESMIEKGADDNYYFSDIAATRDRVYAISSSGGLCVYNYKTVDIKDIEIIPGEGENAESLYAKVRMFNESGKDVNAELYLAVYEAGNATKLKKIEMSEITAENGIETVSETFALDAGGAVLIKAMLIEKGTQKPLCEFSTPIEINNTGDMTIYVDAEADASSADGSKEAPFKTIEDAKEAVRKINRQMSGDITVLISGGRYELDEAISFDEADSGFNGHSVIYKAEEGETPIVSGGRKIEGWTLYDAEKGIYSASAKGINTRHLVVNGERAVRARSKGGLTNAKTDGGALGIYCYDDFIADYKNIQDLELVFIGSFLSKRIGVDNAYKLDSSGRTLLVMNRPFWQYPNSFETYILPVYYENALELLDEENEFYLDTKENKIYYKPKEGTDINNSEVIAPVLEELVKVCGSGLYNRVENIEFNGIEFTETTWMGPTIDGGFYPTQAGHYIMPTYGSAALNSNLTKDSISIINAENISLKECIFNNFGGNGIKVLTSKKVNIVGNKMTNISAGGIYVGTIDKDHANPSDERKLVNDILIENNYLDNIACEYYTSCAVSLGTVQNTKVSHNEISNTPYTAVHVGWGWDSLPRRNIVYVSIENNYIHDVVQKLGDGGAIYTTGYTLADSQANPNFIRNNHIGRVDGNGVFSGAAIYLDTGSSGWMITQNVIDLTESQSAWIPKWCVGNNTNIFDSNYVTTINGGGANVSNTYVSETAEWGEGADVICENAGLTDKYQYLKN